MGRKLVVGHRKELEGIVRMDISLYIIYVIFVKAVVQLYCSGTR